MKRILTLASGAGSNFLHLLQEHQQRPFSGEFSGLIVDREGTGAARIAADFQVPVSVIDYRSFSQKAQFHEALLETILQYRSDLIVGAGFMRILPEAIIKKFENRIINLHPSLLPAFPGLHPQRQALQRGVKVSGCTVHFMDTGVDTGPIIAQSAIAIPEGCDEETLSRMIQSEEHELLPRVVRWYCEDRISVESGLVRVRK
ncbi:MAG: phosphoribosylglycinamide formyltransferase [Leptospiraceae bacterium]|nr:phosphoribosylglycinamide formyltransferase [Leptospiraceae bacterium]